MIRTAKDRYYDLLKEVSPRLAFRVLEIGARPLGNEKEPFLDILEHFPESKLIGFDIDDNLCLKMNAESSEQFTYYSQAIGGRNETVPFHETVHPMCSSLLRPNAELLSRYNGMEVAELQVVTEVETVSLDSFMASSGEAAIDFLKIDVQGAELDIFRGAEETLSDVASIVTEVEFVPLYEDQPLFGDVNQHLSDQGFMFHKFIDLAGRTLKPVVLGKNVNFATQHMWADALFVRSFEAMVSMSGEQLLKLSAMAFVYNSPDVTYACLEKYSDIHPGRELHKEYLDIMTNP